MELESLKRQISFLEKNDEEIGKLVTDRHTHVSAYMKNENPQIEHTMSGMLPRVLCHGQ